MRNSKFKEGAILILTEGEYSDYRTGPLLRCLRDLDITKLAEEFHASKSKWAYGEADTSTFALWITLNGWAEELTYAEIHVGSYGQFKCCGFIAPNTED